MREPRIYTDQTLQLHKIVILELNTAHYLHTVLRLKSGAGVRLFNGQPQEYSGEIIHVHRQQVQVKLHNTSYLEPEPALKLHLILGLSKGERMDVALQKATELGVTHISPLLTERSVIKIEATRRDKRNLHWYQTIISACEQSGRCCIPKLDLPQSLITCLESIHSDQRLVLHPLGSNTLNTITPPIREIALLIGPEGGLTDLELQQAKSYDFTALRLGPRILRTETAPLAALAAIQTLWGDFCMRI